MKYSKLLGNIKNNYEMFDFIDYKYLKQNILDNNFTELLNNTITLFNNNYINKYKNKNNDDIKPQIYEYILINYLSIHKIIKKLKKKSYFI